MISYIGGKSQIGKWIRNYIPNSIETYVEPFSGMYWVFYNIDLDMYPKLENIVYNDFNKLNVNIFNCLINHKLLLEACNNIPVQKKGEDTPVICSELFNKFQKEIYDPNFQVDITKPNYELAAKYAYILTQVFSGANPSKGKFIDLKGKYHSKFTSFKNKLNNPKWQKMFESITQITNLDFEDVINRCDSETTYFYCDPPYYIVGEGNYYSNLSFVREDHERLANCLKSIKGKFSLSYYDFPQLSEWFPKDKYNWVEKEFSKSAMAKSGKPQTKAIEVLIKNY